MLVVDLVDPAVEFFQRAQPPNVVSDYSVISTLQTDNLLDPIAFGWRNALQFLRVKLAFYMLTHLVAQFVCRRCGRHGFAHDEQLASPLRNVAFLERIINASLRSHADTIVQFEVLCSSVGRGVFVRDLRCSRSPRSATRRSNGGTTRCTKQPVSAARRCSVVSFCR